MLMTTDNAERLAIYAKLLKLSDNTYLKDVNNSNYSYVKERYFNNNGNKTNILNIGSGLFTSVTNTIGNFFDYPIMDLRVEGLDSAVEDYVSLNFSVFVLERDENGDKLIRGYAGGYATEKGIPKIFRQYQQIDKNGFIYYFLYEKTYEVGIIKRKLYKLKGKDMFDTGYEEVPLDYIEETRGLEPQTETGYNFLSIFVIGDIDGTSMLQKIESNVYSIDRKICMLDSQFLQNVESIVLFKGLTAQEAGFTNKKGEFRNKMIFTDEIDTSVEFIKNTNEIIDKAMAYEERQIRAISAMTNIPLRFLGMDESDGSSGRNARQQSQAAFIKMMDTYKSKFQKSFQAILKLLNKDDLVRFKDTTLMSSYELVEELKIARESRIISQIEAIKKYQQIDTEHAQKELDIIEDEDKSMELKLGADSSQEKGNSSQERIDRKDQ